MSGRPWLPPILWAALILVLTSIPGHSVPDVGNGDKLAHFAMYGVQGFLTVHAARHGRAGRAAVLVGVVASLLLAGLDEWHQGLIPGREPDLRDWIADGIGATVGSLAAAALLTRREPNA